ncbi:hypothetical protein LIER_09627 [Lithospermum erythrorhizon]|uniref:Uncharacterized protein n=1 Tax=Lithospermum erythrorhizon TaxID=34254 RepID=A0AAV3PL88_LITER
MPFTAQRNAVPMPRKAIDTEKESTKRKSELSQKAMRLTGRIVTISGGRAGGGDSRNSRKNYARRQVYSSASSPMTAQTISFLDAELHGLELPHDDPVTSVPPLGQEPGKSKKRGRENHPCVMSTRSKVQEERDNSPKERESDKKPIPHEEIVKIPFGEDEPEKTFQMGTLLEETHREGLIRLIREYRDIFA